MIAATPENILQCFEFTLSLLKTKVGLAASAEAEILVLESMRQSGQTCPGRFDIYAGAMDLIPSAQRHLVKMTKERLKGVPLQYIVRRQKFLNHYYGSTPPVLIPRPETEVLVSEALRRLSHLEEFLKMPEFWGGEIGLGSGVISIEALCAFPGLKILASEISPVAIQLTIKNANEILGASERHRLTVLRPLSAERVLEDFCEHPKSANIQFLISNPPYLSQADYIENQVLEYESHQALYPTNGDENYFYRKIANDVQAVFPNLRWIFLEVPHERAVIIQNLFSKRKWKSEIVQDLGGSDRVLILDRMD